MPQLRDMDQINLHFIAGIVRQMTSIDVDTTYHRPVPAGFKGI